jgi:hypothetical protein
MVMSSSIFTKRYVDGRSQLRYLPLFNTMNGTLNHQGRLPKLLYTHGKRAAKKADDQFLTALAWGIAFLRDADDLRTRAK